VDCLLADTAFRPGQYLTFRLAGQDFAVEANRVRGILPVHEMVMLAETLQCSPAWAEGVASLSGRDFLVIDLRRKLKLLAPARGRDPMIVVLEYTAPQGLQLVGFVADRVSGLVQARERDYRRGKLHTAGRPRRVLDPDAIAERHVGRTPTSAPDPLVRLPAANS
jgi:chemotaxis signal transduction protein